MNKNMMVLVAVILIVVAGAGGFYAGLQYQKSQPRNTGQFVGRGFGLGNGQGQRSAPVRGQVLSIGTGTITVKQQDGTTKLVVVSSSTVFLKTQTAALSDLKSGDTVMAVGNSNSDGSLTASDIQINPQQLRPSTTPPQGQ
jgi:hypothetical protein